MPCSHRVTLSPFTGRLVMLWLIALENVGNLRDKRVIWVGVGQQGADGKQNLGDGEGGRPLVFEDVEADRTIAVDVHVINFRCERNLWRLEGVVGWEVDVQEEHALMVWGVLGAIIVAYQWNWSASFVGPAEQFAGGSLPRSMSSF